MYEIYTYLVYQDLENELTLNGLILPWSNLNYVFDGKLDELVKNFDLTNAVCYCAHLNMVYQTSETKEIIKLGNIELNALNINPTNQKEGILFHRSNLLNLISRLIKREPRVLNLPITGENAQKSTRRNFYTSLALINSEIGAISNNTFIRQIIREHPTVNSRDTTSNFYARWLKRYWYIYNHLLDDIPDNQKESLLSHIKDFEGNAGLTIKEYFLVATNLFDWFIYSKKFDKHNPGTFYIRRSAFQKDSNYLKYIENISLDMASMKQYFISEASESKNKKTDIFYQDILGFFQHPVLRINEDTFCIIDFRFFIERICSGFIWTLTENKIKGAKGQYGLLLEQYFIFLLRKIFNDEKLTPTNNGPDAILESEKNILIFEFTTEYYKIESLYSSAPNEIHNDLEKILFKNKGGDRKDKPGKFFQLDKYVNQHKCNKNIIPILVTEKYLGDFDLLDNMDQILSKNISKYDNLIKARPTILCLDDLEAFWSCSKNGDNKEHLIDELANRIMNWNKSPKNEFIFDFSSYLYECYKGVEVNQEHNKFFSIKELLNDLSEKSQGIFACLAQYCLFLKRIAKHMRCQ